MRVLVFICFLFCYMANAAAAPLSIIDNVSVKSEIVSVTVEGIEKPEQLQEVLKICQEKDIKVSFFVAGQFIEDNNALIKEAVQQGHQFGNYGTADRYWGNIDTGSITEDLAAAAASIERVTGARPSIVRPPYNYYSDLMVAAAYAYSDAVTIIRGTDLGDWALMTTQAVVDKVKATIDKGAIINVNMKSHVDSAALPAILDEITGQGYKVVTVDQLLAEKKVIKPSSKSPAATMPFMVVNHIAVNTPLVGLTFDDGGNTRQVDEILSILKQYNAQCTFFLLGSWVENNPVVAGKIIADGHEIANHSYSHPEFTMLSTEEMAYELSAGNAAIFVATGQHPAPYFRPPYGAYNYTVAELVSQQGYRAVVTWDIDTRDWSGASAGRMANIVLDQVSPGAIVLFHLHGANTADSLREIIPSLQQQGYVLTTVGKMLQAS